MRGPATLGLTVLLAACTPPVPPVIDGVGGRWEALSELPGGPRQESCVVELGGEIVVVGGVDELGATVAIVEAYDPQAGQWRRLADLPLSLHHANCAVVDGVLVVGGFLLGASFTPDGRTFLYRPGEDAWGEGAAMPEGSERGAAAALGHQGALWVFGGLQQGSVALVSRYLVADDAWEELPALPQALDHLSAHALGERVFVLGGRTDGIERHSARLYELDTAARSFGERAPMPTSRAGFAAAVLGDEIAVAGGEGNLARDDGVFAELELYSPARDQWRSAVPMRTPRHGMGAAAVDGALYVPGGADRQGFAAVATHERFIPSAGGD